MAVLLPACVVQAGSSSAAQALGIDPRNALSLGPDDAAVAAIVRSGSVLVMVAHSDGNGVWTATTIGSHKATAKQNAVALLSYGGATGQHFNTFVYGTAADGIRRVVVAGFPGQRGGEVFNGAWVVVLPDKDVAPNALRWEFIGTTGQVKANGSGIFPPDV